jgi:hypothetical protein
MNENTGLRVFPYLKTLSLTSIERALRPSLSDRRVACRILPFMVTPMIYIRLRVSIALTLRKQQVGYLFIINFQEGNRDSELPLCISFHIFKNMIDTSRDHSTLYVNIPIPCITPNAVKRVLTSEDGVRFSTACLTICHDDPIKSIENIADYRLCNLVICMLLITLLINDLVKEEVSLIIVWSD